VNTTAVISAGIADSTKIRRRKLGEYRKTRKTNPQNRRGRVRVMANAVDTRPETQNLYQQLWRTVSRQIQRPALFKGEND